jgi:DNA helicase-2/ATP-dependent DNA helicase PcrA
MAIVEVLPTRVVGDPMQGIFDFRDEDPLVDFDEHLYATFERLEDLVDPHRWATTNPALGEWLVYARAAIAGGEAVDFNNAPVSVWESDPAIVTARAKELAGADGSVVVIRAQAPQAHRFAKGLGGRYQSMEEMECKALFDAVSSLDDATRLERGAILIEFAQSVVSGLGNTGTVGRRIESYRRGEFPSVPNGQYGPVISSLNSFAESGDAAAGRNALRHLIDASSKTPFRHELLGEMDRTLGYVVFHPELSFAEAAWRVRDVTRRRGGRPWRLSVGRTLLVRGLNANTPSLWTYHSTTPAPSTWH